MKHYLKRKVKNAIVNKTQLLVVQHQKIIIKKIINKSQL